MDDKQTNPVVEQPQPVQPAPAPQQPAPSTGTGHDSNPFTTTLTGVKKLFRLNTNALIGTVLFNIVVGVFIVITVIVAILAAVAFFIQSDPTLAFYAAASLPPDALTFAQSMAPSSIYVTWALCFVVLVFFVALGQAIQVKLVTASADNKTIGFGDLFKQGMKSVLPLLGLTALVVLVFILSFVILGLIGVVLGPSLFLLVPLLIIAAFYFSIRLAFSSFSIVEEGVGPIASLKRSMELTKGHFAETLGVAAATMVIVFVPTIILDLLAGVGGAMGGIFQLISVVVSLIVSTIAIVGFAERFVQLRNIKTGVATATRTHVSNYLAIVAAIVCMIISGSMSPRMQLNNPDQTQQPYDTTQLEQMLKDQEGQQPTGDPNAQDLFNDEYTVPEESQTTPSYNVN